MSERREEDFLRQIAENLDDPEPLLVYADWLMEQGGEAATHGEYIRLSHEETQRTTQGEKASDFYPRLYEVRLASHARIMRSVESLPPMFYEVGGVIRSYDAPALDRFSDLLETIFEAAPTLQSVHVRMWCPGAGEFVKLAESARLSNLRELVVQGSHRSKEPRMSDDELATLAGTKGLASLRHLRLRCHAIGDKGIQALASSDLMSQLKTLALSEASLRGNGVASLCRSPHCSELTHLDLSDNPVGVRGVRALAQSSSFSNLEVLLLRRTKMGDAGARALALTETLPKLKHVDAAENNLDEAVARQLQARFPPPRT